ncbi:vacuolar protein sorting-associated protein 26B-like isoform X2 [Lepeophtheirus salmonis]|uniref:Vacuolar protein sorting-associated protein 26 n=1 Tax=Lepeophtheirus salmonis TaxID=72036 RepID=A0A0K2T1W2_LEPSM|nr:vacuolar protein sorting-associated protein 26B-like isoform X2 [Lepeophtheirus salmonis]
MSFFGLNFGQSAEVDIILDDQDKIKTGELKDENGRKERYFLFYDGESVAGKVNVTLHRKTNKLEHQGIKIEFIGQIEMYYDRGNHHEFLSLCKDLVRPGELTQNNSFDFEFSKVEKPYECYTGANVRLRYFLRVTIIRRLTDITKEMNILVHTLAHFPETNNPIKMEVGIEECLHIEFEYNKSKYHLKDVIVGKIYFLLVRIKIKYMEIAIIKRESTGSGPSSFSDTDTIAKYEIMDGAPVKGESIPIRVFLAGYDLTPTMREVNKKFSVKYFLNLVLVDEEERRYFKQQEIVLWRKSDKMRKSMSQHPQANYSTSNSAASIPQHLSTHQNIPHAMARHFPAGKDTIVRTAPTPTSPSSDDLAATFGAPEITTNTTTTNNSSTTSNNNNNNILANPTATVIPNTHLVRGHSSSEEIEEVESEPEFLEKEVAVPLPISNNEHEESDENENNNNTSSSVLVPEEKNEDRNVSKSPLTTSDPHE